ncbi:hypothetical protein WFS18_01415 [Ureaplasma parvum]|jgi:hypothetical protein|uniref:Uncharacterized protein n=1 Tax=Ureaplasma parvum serovar 3 (strain ATCC 27815 / 27 / NCTC 11736) TaxID=505682 RepID=A0A2C9DZ08_UREP2|nr:hypothetical protein [Ureaplasma parvum]ACA33231.1 hypothetical protein UPA3_0096 [Ureaplasma parvum serovar 3 str. ATCC 27815]EDT87822.1 hypothetical protein UPA14_E0352 [Ureaplasma parvum serovar 14 str. ATCC 33697]EDU19411.1 hypothetical protein UPA6_A0099 [Ureaplasma parvum serovar 6 str. ATCC 27818]MDU7891770.1 hypothetical protein [Ureaplasma parvum]
MIINFQMLIDLYKNYIGKENIQLPSNFSKEDIVMKKIQKVVK